MSSVIKLNKKDFSPILKFKKKEYKFLAPNVFKYKNKFAILYCNRGSKKKIFQGNLNLATSKNLKNWDKDYFFLQPKKGNYLSFTKSSILQKKNKFLLFVEAQNRFYSDILCFESTNLKNWKKNKNFILSNKKNKFHSPFIFQNKNLYLFFSKDGNQIESIELNKKFKIKKRKICFKKSLLIENFSIYAPFVFKIKKYFIMLYSAWGSKSKGNINFALSLNLIDWIKSEKYLFQFPEPYKIIAEPFILKKGKYLYFYFEYKKNNKWNISYKKFNLKFSNNLINQIVKKTK